MYLRKKAVRHDKCEYMGRSARLNMKRTEPRKKHKIKGTPTKKKKKKDSNARCRKQGGAAIWQTITSQRKAFPVINGEYLVFE